MRWLGCTPNSVIRASALILLVGRAIACDAGETLRTPEARDGGPQEIGRPVQPDAARDDVSFPDTSDPDSMVLEECELGDVDHEQGSCADACASAGWICHPQSQDDDRAGIVFYHPPGRPGSSCGRPVSCDDRFERSSRCTSSDAEPRPVGRLLCNCCPPF